MHTEINTSNINRVWADLLIEELVRAGAGLFCLAPGSRSSPLTAAVASNSRAEHLIHFDERGAAFYALGYARATRRPAVWITTSGTAVANGLPAVVEASIDGVPLILLTADRPPELRQTGANQTIDQVKIFGDYTRWQFELPAPTSEIDPAAVLTTADQAVYRARRAPAGPVHLNLMLREPLAPDDDGRSYDSYLEPVAAWRQDRKPYTAYSLPQLAPDRDHLRMLAAFLQGIRRGIIVAGRLDSPAQGDAVRWLAERLKWPLLPDACSQLRLCDDSPVIVPYYDLALGSDTFRRDHPPEAVLYFGGRATSKALGRYLADAAPENWTVIRESPERFDPDHRVRRYIEADIVGLCQAIVDALDDSEADDAWLADWRSASDAAVHVIETKTPAAGPGDLSEPQSARILSTELPDGSGLFLGCSMPVRDMDTFAAPSDRAVYVAANRGASGIDGTLATAAGFAHGLGDVVTVVIGDLALLHDLNSLALVKQSSVPIIILVVNNHGGGIFSFLPIARHPDLFERYFGTPHDLRFEQAAAMFGLAYHAVESPAALRERYAEAVRDRTSVILEITTNREQNVQLHREIERLVIEALD